MERAFVSHTSADKIFCRELVNALTDNGVSVWYDEHDLDTGKLYEQIEQELLSCTIFVVVLSPQAICSQWVSDECSWAYDLYKRKRIKKFLPVVAVEIDEDHLRPLIRSFRRIAIEGTKPFSKEEAIRKTLQALGVKNKSQQQSYELSLLGNTNNSYLTRLMLSTEYAHVYELPLVSNETHNVALHVDVRNAPYGLIQAIIQIFTQNSVYLTHTKEDSTGHKNTTIWVGTQKMHTPGDVQGVPNDYIFYFGK